MRHGWVKFKASDAQNVRRGKAWVCHQFCSEIYVLRSLNVQKLTESIEDMNAESLNYWLSKFVQEVANKSSGRCSSRSLYSILCGLKCFLVEKNGEDALNPALAVSDKRYPFDCFWKILFVVCIVQLMLSFPVGLGHSAEFWTLIMRWKMQIDAAILFCASKTAFKSEGVEEDEKESS